MVIISLGNCHYIGDITGNRHFIINFWHLGDDQSDVYIMQGDLQKLISAK